MKLDLGVKQTMRNDNPDEGKGPFSSYFYRKFAKIYNNSPDFYRDIVGRDGYKIITRT